MMWNAVTKSSVHVTVITIGLHCKICNNYCKITYLFLGYRSAGFLAYLSTSAEGTADNTYILFDTEKYDYGDNYNPSTGIYSAQKKKLSAPEQGQNFPLILVIQLFFMAMYNRMVQNRFESHQ